MQETVPLTFGSKVVPFPPTSPIPASRLRLWPPAIEKAPPT